jgi:density-regulated protein DRP1
MKVTILKMKRSGKKIQSVIIGLDAFGCDLAAVAKIMSKKFATGANQAETDHHGVTYNAIQVQGDVTERIEEIIEVDLAKYKIPKEAIVIEDAGNKKGRKR